MKNIFCWLTLLAPTALLANTDSCLISPVSPAARQLITNIYGCRFHPLAHKWKFHQGTDFRASMDTPLIAAREGDIQYFFSNAGGREVRIVGGAKPVLRYLHLNRLTIEPGTHVNVGEEIARSGKTGNVTAEHLHFEVLKKKTRRAGSIHVNPEPLLCKKVEHKPGAEVSGGSPIYAPTNGICDGNLKEPLHGTTTGVMQRFFNTQSASLISTRVSNFFTMLSSPLTRLMPSATTETSTAASIAPTIEQFDDVSTVEVISTEVLKRFSNPAWHAEQAERGIVPLLTEYVHMKALENFLNLHNQQLQERIENLLAIRLARQNRRDIEELLLEQRRSAAYAANH